MLLLNIFFTVFDKYAIMVIEIVGGQKNMPRNIQLQDDVYTRLETFRGKRETFSEAVNRLLTLLSKVSELRDVLEGGIKYEEWKEEQLDKIAQGK